MSKRLLCLSCLPVCAEGHLKTFPLLLHLLVEMNSKHGLCGLSPPLPRTVRECFIQSSHSLYICLKISQSTSILSGVNPAGLLWLGWSYIEHESRKLGCRKSGTQISLPATPIYSVRVESDNSTFDKQLKVKLPLSFLRKWCMTDYTCYMYSMHIHMFHTW